MYAEKRLATNVAAISSSCRRATVAEGKPPADVAELDGSVAFPPSMFASCNIQLGPCINGPLLLHAQSCVHRGEGFGTWTPLEGANALQAPRLPAEAGLAMRFTFDKTLFPDYFPVESVFFTRQQWREIKQVAQNAPPYNKVAEVYVAVLLRLLAPLEEAMYRLPSIERDKGPLLSPCRYVS